jgi:hypothetical protein
VLARLTTGPCAGQAVTIPKALWDLGTLHMLGEPDPAPVYDFYEPDAPVHALRLPVHTYRRTLMASGPVYLASTFTWYEWHHVSTS